MREIPRQLKEESEALMTRRRVALAIVERGETFLIARRGSGAFAGLWELPGGKCLEGEDPATCAVREVLEETGLDVAPMAEPLVMTHVYAEAEIEFHAFFCRVLRGEPRALTSEAIAWIAWDDIDRYSFPEANAKLFVMARRRRASASAKTGRTSSPPPPAYKFIAIGMVSGLLAGAAAGMTVWVFSNSAAFFYGSTTAGALLGLLVGRRLRQVVPQDTKDESSP